MFSDMGSIAAGGAANSKMKAVVSQQAVDSITVLTEAYTEVDKLVVSASLSYDGGSAVLIPGINAYPLFEISDFFGGMSLAAVYEKINSDVTARGAMIQPQVAAEIPLGHIQLSGDDELDALIVNSSALTSSTGGASAWLTDEGAARERILKYVERSGENATFHDPLAIFVYRLATSTNELDMSKLDPGDLQVSVNTGGNEDTFDCRAAWAWTAAHGNFCASAPRRTACVYLDRRNSNPGAKVVVQLSGADKASYGVIGIERLVIPGRAGLSRAVLRELLAGRAAAVEKANPDLARELKMANRLRSSALIRAGK